MISILLVLFLAAVLAVGSGYDSMTGWIGNLAGLAGKS
jgi:hypothetical protein